MVYHGLLYALVHKVQSAWDREREKDEFWTELREEELEDVKSSTSSKDFELCLEPIFPISKRWITSIRPVGPFESRCCCRCRLVPWTLEPLESWLPSCAIIPYKEIHLITMRTFDDDDDDDDNKSNRCGNTMCWRKSPFLIVMIDKKNGKSQTERSPSPRGLEVIWRSACAQSIVMRRRFLSISQPDSFPVNWNDWWWWFTRLDTN